MEQSRIGMIRRQFWQLEEPDNVRNIVLSFVLAKCSDSVTTWVMPKNNPTPKTRICVN